MTTLIQTQFVPGWAVIIPLLILAGLWLWAFLRAVEEPTLEERTRPLWDDVWDGYVKNGPAIQPRPQGWPRRLCDPPEEDT